MHDDNSVPQSRKIVCLVDDEADITSVIKKGLEQEGYIVHDYNDLIEAWEYFKENGKNCTVVLSDVRMSGMNGFEFCRKVKALRPEAPIILMTAFEMNQSEVSKVMPSASVDGLSRNPYP